MHKYATTAEIKMAYSKTSHSTDSVPSRSNWMPLSRPEAAIIGIASKNENRAAAARSRLQKSAAVIVTPEREVPGINARI